MRRKNGTQGMKCWGCFHGIVHQNIEGERGLVAIPGSGSPPGKQASRVVGQKTESSVLGPVFSCWGCLQGNWRAGAWSYIIILSI